MRSPNCNGAPLSAKPQRPLDRWPQKKTPPWATAGLPKRSAWRLNVRKIAKPDSVCNAKVLALASSRAVSPRRPKLTCATLNGALDASGNWPTKVTLTARRSSSGLASPANWRGSKRRRRDDLPRSYRCRSGQTARPTDLESRQAVPQGVRPRWQGPRCKMVDGFRFRRNCNRSARSPNRRRGVRRQRAIRSEHLGDGRAGTAHQLEHERGRDLERAQVEAHEAEVSREVAEHRRPIDRLEVMGRAGKGR